MNTIPIIDLNPLFTGKLHDLKKLASEFETIFSTIGICFLVNHQIPDPIFTEIFNASKNFHQLPLEEKLTYESPNGFSGYMSMRREKLEKDDRSPRKINQSESFIINNKPKACEQNQWKHNLLCSEQLWPEHLKNFKMDVLKYCDALQNLCKKLISIFSLAMNFDPNYLDQYFTDPSISLRLFYYPSSTKPDLYGLNPHTDFGCLTLLLQDEVGGLQIEYNNTWIDVPYIKNALILNIGDVMSLWSNKHLKPCLHRVINTSTRTRYSIPFFYDCNIDTPISSLVKIKNDRNKSDKSPLFFGEYITKIIKAIYNID